MPRRCSKPKWSRMLTPSLAAWSWSRRTPWAANSWRSTASMVYPLDREAMLVGSWRSWSLTSLMSSTMSLIFVRLWAASTFCAGISFSLVSLNPHFALFCWLDWSILQKSTIRDYQGFFLAPIVGGCAFHSQRKSQTGNLHTPWQGYEILWRKGRVQQFLHPHFVVWYITKLLRTATQMGFSIVRNRCDEAIEDQHMACAGIRNGEYPISQTLSCAAYGTAANCLLCKGLK